MIEIIYTLVLTHITIVCVTLYLHRAQAHRSIEFHPVLAHAMRFWLWLTTGMITKQWVAIHRKHHRYTDVEGDPHSPAVYGIKEIMFKGVAYYYRAGKDAKMIMQYGKGTPDDWIERHLYTPYSFLGPTLMLIINLVIFQWWGLAVWAVQMLWIPFWAAGVVNGLGHWFGYRNYETRDNSRNIFPFGIIIGGEELHNNHHRHPSSAKMSTEVFEFDIGWMWLNMFRMLRLARLTQEK